MGRAGTATNAEGLREVVGISGVPSAGWFVVVRLPETEALQPVASMTGTLAFTSSVTTGLLLLVLGVALARTLAPLRRAAREVAMMAHDAAPLVKLPIVRRDEMGELAFGFNSLVDAIDDRTASLESTKADLERSLAEVRQLSGLLPICSYCKKIRDAQGYWNRLEEYVEKHSDVQFSHGICRECAEKHYPDIDLDDE